jgi:hypothetical protein
MNKKASFILGAGFSHVLAGQKITSDFSKLLHQKFKQEFKKQTYENKLTEYILGLGEAFNFETLIDNLRFMNELRASGYQQLPEGASIDNCIHFIYQNLINEYLDFELNETLKKKFLGLIKLLLGKGYEIHIFDLNFDQVLEEIFYESEFRSQFNDFFPHHEYLKNESGETIRFSSIFDKTKINKINLYKPHGAFNIIYTNDAMSQNHLGVGFAQNDFEYRNIRLGFRKILFKRDRENQIKQKLKQDYNLALKEYLNFTPMSGDKGLGYSLLMGNNYKLAMVGYAQTYPKFCYRQLNDILAESTFISLIGYGGKDLDINPSLRDSKMPTEFFWDLLGTSPKTVVYFNDENIPQELLCKDDENLGFEEYLNKPIFNKKNGGGGGELPPSSENPS